MRNNPRERLANMKYSACAPRVPSGLMMLVRRWVRIATQDNLEDWERDEDGNVMASLYGAIPMADSGAQGSRFFAADSMSRLPLDRNHKEDEPRCSYR